MALDEVALLWAKNTPWWISLHEDTYVSQTHCSWLDWRPASCLDWHPGTVRSPCKATRSCRSRSVRPLPGRDALTRCWQCTCHYLQQLRRSIDMHMHRLNDHSLQVLVLRIRSKLVRLHFIQCRLAATGITCLTVIPLIIFKPMVTRTNKEAVGFSVLLVYVRILLNNRQWPNYEESKFYCIVLHTYLLH